MLSPSFGLPKGPVGFSIIGLNPNHVSTAVFVPRVAQ